MNQRFATRFFSLTLAFLLASTCFCSFAVTADTKTFRLSQGNIVIGADGDGHYVKVGEQRTTLPADTEIVIEGGDVATDHTIRVCDNVTAAITLSGVRIESGAFLTAPIELCGAENVTLTVNGANSLSAPQYMAALQIGRYAKIKILGSGSLSVRGGMSAAGIGGGWKSGTPGAPCGDITLGGSVTVSAYGGDFGAAIGGGEGGASGSIVITDQAKVYALGGKQAAAIGSGSGARSRTVTITSSAVVEAAGGDFGAGIGSGKGGAASKITVSGSANVRAAGGAGASALGSGEGGSATMISIGENASVRARGGDGAAAIGAGKDSPLTVGVSISGFSSVFAIGGNEAAGIGGAGRSAGILTITDSALVETYGGRSGAGIGSGKSGSVAEVNIDGRVSVYSYGGLSGAGIGSGESGSYEKISVRGFSSVQALGGKYAAGIGGGKTAVCGEIRICENASVTAQGGNFGAGIGTGAKNAPDYAPTAGTIYLYDNAAVRAAGGKSASGVGGGLYASGGKVVVSGTVSLDAYKDLTIALDASTPETKADYSIVEAALNKVPKNLADYTDQSVEILNSTIQQIVYDLPSSQQAQVDTYAAAIERAISILVKKTVTRSLTLSAESFASGEAIVVDWKGATSPKDRILVLKKDHLPSDTAIDPMFNVSYGTPLLSAYCIGADGAVAAEGTASLVLDETHFLRTLGYTGLPEGAYTVYFCPEGTDTPAALAHFTVTGTALAEADYSAVEEAIKKIPRDSSLYTKESWAALQNAIGSVVYALGADEQARVDGFAKAIRDAISALVSAESAPAASPETPPATSTASDPSSAARAFTLPGGETEEYRVSNLIQSSESREVTQIQLLAQSSGAPETPGWGMIPLQSSNVETTGADSVVSAINRVVSVEDISVQASEVFDTQGIEAANVGAGAGCTMSGSFDIADTALINNAVASATLTLEYGASIGSLSFDYAPSASFSLPAAPTCPGYVFKGWSTDEAGTSPVSGNFTLSSNLTFYANWEVVPVSIEKDFQFSSGALGLEYSETLQLQEASANFTVSLSQGELPKGLTLDPATGTIAGVPTDLGTFSFTLLIVDANGTRTEEDYFITVYQPVDMTFVFYTSNNEHSATAGDILFSYSYRDRGNGSLKESAPVNLSELLKQISATALQPESVDTLTLSVGAYVGEPVQLFFRNTSEEDGYRIDKVVISSAGGDGMDAFEKTYQVNTWIGHIDDANFFESGAFVIFLVLLLLLLILLGVFFFLRFRKRKTGKPAGVFSANAAQKKAASPFRSAPAPRTGALPQDAPVAKGAQPRPIPRRTPAKKPGAPQAKKTGAPPEQKK